MNRSSIFAFLPAIFIALTSCSDKIESEAPNLPEGLVNGEDSKIDKRLYAIGQFFGPFTCTATYIEVPFQTLDSPAYIITNGHCAVEIFEDNPIYIDRPISAEVVFKNVYGIPENQHVKFSTKKIAYATMKGTDLAIIELNLTNRELQKAGIQPLKLATELPVKGAQVQALGYPLSLTPINLRVSKGELGSVTTIAEFIWLWNDFYSIFLKNIASGSSGSPVFEDLSKGVWGMVNTTTIDAVGTCDLGAPCELAQNVSPSTKFETTYILDVLDIRSSFNARGVFDINLNSNLLEKPSGFEVSLKDGVRNFGKSDLEIRKLTFNSSVMGTTYRIDPFETYDWKNSSGFLPMTSETTEVNYPDKEGFYVLTLQANSKKNRLTFKMDFTEPDAALIRLNQNKLVGGDYLVHPIFIYPELVSYNWKIGPLATCDCADQKDYQIYNRNPINISAKELPVKICVIGYDLAGNPSKLREFVINS
jgi:V8-like Glu-specific endopeptidase